MFRSLRTLYQDSLLPQSCEAAAIPSGKGMKPRLPAARAFRSRSPGEGPANAIVPDEYSATSAVLGDSAFSKAGWTDYLTTGHGAGPPRIQGRVNKSGWNSSRRPIRTVSQERGHPMLNAIT